MFFIGALSIVFKRVIFVVILKNFSVNLYHYVKTINHEKNNAIRNQLFTFFKLQ